MWYPQPYLYSLRLSSAFVDAIIAIYMCYIVKSSGPSLRRSVLLYCLSDVQVDLSCIARTISSVVWSLSRSIPEYGPHWWPSLLCVLQVVASFPICVKCGSWCIFQLVIIPENYAFSIVELPLISLYYNTLLGNLNARHYITSFRPYWAECLDKDRVLATANTSLTQLHFVSLVMDCYVWGIYSAFLARCWYLSRVGRGGHSRYEGSADRPWCGRKPQTKTTTPEYVLILTITKEVDNLDSLVCRCRTIRFIRYI